MPDIQAQSSDGVVHSFPDGTKPEVIDRVMKQYAQSRQSPQATPSPAEQQLNKEAEPWKKVSTGAGLYEQAKQVPGAIWQGVKNIPAGIGGLADTIANPWTAAANAAPEIGEQAQKAQQNINKPLGGLEAAGRYAAIATAPVGGLWAAQKGEQAGRGDVLPAAAETATTLGGLHLIPAKMLADYGTKVSEAGRLLRQQDAINRGQVQIVNEMVRKPLAEFDAKINQEVAAHAQGAIQADELARSRKQTGMVNAYDAVGDASERIGKVGTATPAVQDLLDRASQPMTLNEAKNLSSEVGKQASALSRQGNARNASVLNILYDGLHQATQAQAESLGMGKSWQQYIDLHRSYKGMQDGLLGELTDEPIHANVLNKMIDPKRGTELGEIVDEMKKRGMDTDAFEDAREHASKLDQLQKRSGNLFVSKIRGIINHPLTVTPAVVGSALVGHAMGVPGMGLVLPLIVASKLSGLLDAREAVSLMKEIGKNMPQDATRVGEPLPGPMQVQTPNISTTEPPPAEATGPKRPGQMTKRELADHIRRNRRQ